MSKSQAMHKLMIVVGLLLILLVTMQSHGSPLHHKMQVEVHPGLKMIKATVTVNFPKNSPRKLSFLIHKDLQISLTSKDDSLVLLHGPTTSAPYAEYGLALGSQDSAASFHYQGIIHDPVKQQKSEGLIDPEGAVLFGSSYWYPVFLDAPKSFDLSIQTPAEWRSLSQGQITSTEVRGNTRVTRFVEIYPQDEIYLVAGPFFTYETESKGGKKIQVLLRKNDPSLAQTFLSTVPGYIEEYSSLIGDYPYSSFTVVENFWETGYGMPGFTLLGPSVLRLPFILNSSLPHEVLHNWWGNSVYVDYEKGNWSEGLTTYMADYYQQEKLGKDKDYRRSVLTNYEDFVTANPGRDFPVKDFKGRHNQSSQAVGYGKTMMIFHMLEKRFGKDLFLKSLQSFYKENVFSRATFAEIQTSFEKTTGQNLEAFFKQWLDQSGAPQIELNDVKVMRWLDGSYSSTFLISQSQKSIYDLQIPVLWTLENGEEIKQLVQLNQASQIYSLVTKYRPTRISVDPGFNIFRKIYTEERPATLSAVFGSSDVHIYFDPAQKGVNDFIQVWNTALEGKKHLHPIKDAFQLEKNGAIVFVGEKEAFQNFVKNELQGQNFEVTSQTITIEGQKYNFTEASSVITLRLKQNSQQTLVWVRWSPDNTPADWAQRLTHYGSFGLLIFKGRPAVLKSHWPTLNSPLQRELQKAL
ncbi:M1 family metallopeptidase [Bdellovibrio bacteriovorus]